MVAQVHYRTVPTSQAVEYRSYLNRSALPDYGAAPGNKGVYFFEREEGGMTHFATIVFWSNARSSASFAERSSNQTKRCDKAGNAIEEIEQNATLYRVVGESWWDPDRQRRRTT